MSGKYYAVRCGRVPGIYTDWDACRGQVTGFPNACFKGFSSLTEAEAFLRQEEPQAPAPAEGPEEAFPEAYVDGSYNQADGSFGCGAVLLWEGEEICLSEKPEDQSLAAMRNVAGEIRAAELAMEWALERQLPGIIIYHDYAGIAHWATGTWQAKQPGTQAYRDYCRSLEGRLILRFEKVKGHSHNHYNDLADSLAKQAVGLEPEKTEKKNGK